ncbi:GNAT family N-acetyltransferase [Chitinimonas lacunae]|uniref:GNAT family N-acetyltransferase n=1 Tax=Chitinimonas lacunae TaxID=1963018 RepID=A0ABV8MXN4_9NEIS
MTAELFSPLDSARFGLRVGKAYPLCAATLPTVLEQCRQEGLQLLLARCPTEDGESVRALEAAGFRLMDTLVYLRRPLSESDLQTVATVRPARPDDVPLLADVVRRTFTSYVGHYHADGRLDRAQVEQIYPDWACRAVTVEGVADQVLIAEHAGQLAGFAVLKRLDAERCDGLLYGVDPRWRRLGLYRQLLAASFAWGRRIGCTAMEYSTQLSNLPALRTVIRQGFVPERSLHTFHRWFDGDGRDDRDTLQ